MTREHIQKIGDKAIQVAIKYLKKKHPKKKIIEVGNNRNEGCDIKIGSNIFIEVKGTR